MRANIKLKSVNPFPKKDLNIFSIGGFSAKSTDGRTFDFDWNESASGLENDENGYLIIDCELRDFNDEDFEEINSQNGVKQEEITPEFIVSSELTELYYEAYKDDVDSELIPFDVFQFDAYEWNDERKVYEGDSFPEETLKAFNEKYAAYR